MRFFVQGEFHQTTSPDPITVESLEGFDIFSNIHSGILIRNWLPSDYYTEEFISESLQIISRIIVKIIGRLKNGE
jgi:hypothetical protein